ncbi:MAG: hypothetical protein ABR524_04750 [Thermoanaerobaculia bacterium]
MWVFDGEVWVPEGSEEQSAPKRKPAPEHYDRLGPELQIVPQIRRREREELPPFPIAIP